jgi:hypothetical protein
VIPVTFGGRKTWLLEVRKGRMAVKRLFILAALALFLAAHGVVGFMSIYPQMAIEDGSGGWSGGGP